MTTQEALDIFFKSVIGQIRTDQGAKGITASGRSSDSLAYVTDATGGQMTGSNYFDWQIVGRKPGKGTPFDPGSTKYGVKTRGKNKGQGRGDFPNLSEWMENKPSAQSKFDWTSKSESGKIGLLYIINRKIKSEGTDIFVGKRSGLSFNQIVDKNISILLGNIAQLKVKEFTTFLKAELQK